MESIHQEIIIPKANITLTIKREDLIHPIISGNKYRKLKYNLLEASNLQIKTLLTFGGAFSNHILAVAAAGKENGFSTIGIIRGEELSDKIEMNPTLQKARDYGMNLHFITRDEYRLKNSKEFYNTLKKKFGVFYLIPEGGTNELAIKGCEEIISSNDKNFDFICCSVGTGGTISGIINSSEISQQVLGFPSLKGDFLQQDICKFAKKTNWKLINDYHFGGYGKVTEELIFFINQFYATYKIPLDPIYTGKMVFGVFDLINKNWFPINSKILLIHTGGIQGVEGMNNLLRQKKQLEIKIDET